MRLLPLKIAENRQFIVGTCNELAYAWITKGEAFATFLIGPLCSGKKHLSLLWQKRFEEGQIIDLINLCAEEELFHFFNSSKEKGKKLLFLSTKHPKKLDLKLKDLESRLLSCHVVEILPPDEDTLKKLYKALFYTHGLIINDDVVNFLIFRFERTYEEVYNVVNQLENLNIPITIPTIKEYFNL